MSQISIGVPLEGMTVFGGTRQGVQGSLALRSGQDNANLAAAKRGSFLRLASSNASGVVAYWDVFVDSSGKLRISSASGADIGSDPPADTEAGGTIVGGQA